MIEEKLQIHKRTASTPTLPKRIWVVSGSLSPDLSTPSLSTIFALQLLIASQKQFRGFKNSLVLGGRAPSFSI